MVMGRRLLKASSLDRDENCLGKAAKSSGDQFQQIKKVDFQMPQINNILVCMSNDQQNQLNTITENQNGSWRSKTLIIDPTAPPTKHLRITSQLQRRLILSLLNQANRNQQQIDRINGNSTENFLRNQTNKNISNQLSKTRHSFLQSQRDILNLHRNPEMINQINQGSNYLERYGLRN